MEVTPVLPMPDIGLLVNDRPLALRRGFYW